ncbi:hypothetical protein H6G33_10040 [Calothrix sp. FACHB-1219]|uniref:hypothetical protein n=1 Tax=unclassified Calothrix TaxID=2619626 RepID=UPI001684727B|nr:MULTISPECIES: hypothetical protein [unclassified Calothrix]MBD2201687.1 hypothetical protein [Calothrix sp. FACHB-168]MBD2217373.1 hypothetical protein [Calothrix sp. FACHB-1219]
MSSTFIHSYLIEKIGAPLKLWYLVRAMDKNGSGKSILDSKYIQKTLDISKTTLWRYTKSNLFFKIIRRGELYTFYYKSLVRICLENEVDNWGASCEIEIEDIKDLKYYSTLATQLSLQGQSRYLANKSLTKNSNRNKPLSDKDIASLFNNGTNPISDISTGIILLRSGVLFVNDKWSSFGGSQLTVANRLGVSIRTVNSRLRRAQKIRVAQYSPDNRFFLREALFNDEENWTNTSSKFFTTTLLYDSAAVVVKRPSIYYPQLALSSKRYRRAALNRAWAKKGVDII